MDQYIKLALELDFNQISPYKRGLYALFFLYNKPMRVISYFLAMIFLSSCGGGGGGGSSIPFEITLAPNSFSVNEDNTYTGSISASANEVVTLNYIISSTTSNGSLSLSGSGSISYEPNLNFNGQDEFTYSVSAVEKNITRSSTVSITVNPVNDAPTITIDSKSEFDDTNLLFDQNPVFSISFSDVDNSEEELIFSAKANSVSVPSTFTSTGTGTADIELDLSSVSTGGLFNTEITVTDGALSDSDLFTTWLISNKTIVTINQDVNPEDGFDGGEKIAKDYYVYYLSGNPTSRGRTKYLFIGDSLDGQGDIDRYRRALIASVNKLRNSDASEFFSEDYFTVVSAEPVDPDGTSPVGVRTGCYDFDEDIYCIGEMDVDIFDNLLPDNVLVSVLTRVVNPDTGIGRGVNQGYKNIQRIRDDDPERTQHTLMHELGHAHGYMGDEYRSDERDLTDNGNNVNTSTQSDVNLIKWTHHIDDKQNVLGKDIKVCYNRSDGTIADFDDVGINIEDCNCFVNNWDSNGNFVSKNPECSQVGLFEGNYYGLYDNYRPTFCSVMDKCTSGGYGKVNVEGFAVGSIQNQGFYRADSLRYTRDDSGSRNGIEIEMDVSYDTSKITLKWYVNGVEDTTKENQTTVIFERPANNAIEFYTAKAIDLSGTISVDDDITDYNDFYEGAFQSYFGWYSEETGWVIENDSSQYFKYDYGSLYGPLGFTWAFNWERL
ncbi:MAG: Ig-like domain-containing protein [Gammaproteobacteria bacterium]